MDKDRNLPLGNEPVDSSNGHHQGEGGDNRLNPHPGHQKAVPQPGATAKIRGMVLNIPFRALMARIMFTQMLRSETIPAVLEKRGIRVDRPTPLDFSQAIQTPDWQQGSMFGCMPPRDVLLTVGNEIRDIVNSCV